MTIKQLFVDGKKTDRKEDWENAEVAFHDCRKQYYLLLQSIIKLSDAILVDDDQLIKKIMPGMKEDAVEKAIFHYAKPKSYRDSTLQERFIERHKENELKQKKQEIINRMNLTEEEMQILGIN